MNGWLFTPQIPALSIAVWVLVALALMFLGRNTAHRALLRGARLGHAQLRLVARALQRAADRGAQRNQQALRELQQELVRRQMERELQRLGDVVERDLAGFQQLQRQLNEQVTAVAEDYEHATQVPPAAPEWVAAVDAIARLPADASADTVGRILSDIHTTIQSQQREAMREYRWTVNARHKILAGMRPHWRKLAALLEQVTVKLDGLQRRIRHIDRLMERFEALLGGGRVTHTAIGARFVLSALVLGLAATVAVFNFELLSRPLTQAFGDARLGPLPLASYAAVVHTLAVVGLGIVLFEALQVTRMFPLICGMPVRARRLLVFLAGTLLAVLAVLESLLAAWWQAQNPGLPLQVLGLLGILVPPLLVLAMLPLESFSYTLRPMMASVGVAVMHLVAVAARFLGMLLLQLGQLAVQLYDLVLVLPLAGQRVWRWRRTRAAPDSASEREHEQDTPVRPVALASRPARESIKR